MVTMTTIGLASLALLVLGSWVIYKVLCGVFLLLGYFFRFLGLLLRHVFRFVQSELVDALHLLGALVTAAAVVPLALMNLFLVRLPQAAHYGRAVEDELLSATLCLYRVALGNPLRFLGLGPVLDGFERRIPDVMEHAPRRRPRRGEADRFPGYRVTDVLPPGGSGARLFVARPTPEKKAACREAGIPLPDEVVIKSFAVSAGSTLPQIVRESRALAAARQLRLVLEHSLGEDHFYYVMPYVRGEQLSAYVQHLHEASPPAGLGGRQLGLVVGLTQDLLYTLDRFHAVGLWHKDVKPANLIVAGDHAHLVDLGLVTPLQSAMTLTTHGTEYYRDPEMVRLALQGVKVHEVDGVKFDVYSAGAVLFSMIENSFPAHGSLSRITKRCPEALQWIVRRAMADLSARYGSAREMLDDLIALDTSGDPFALRPADLPSFARARGGAAPTPAAHAPPPPPPAPAWDPAIRAPLDPERTRRRRRRGLAAVAAVALGVLGARHLVSAARGPGHRPATVATVVEASRFGPREREALRLARRTTRALEAEVLPDLSAAWPEELAARALPTPGSTVPEGRPLGRVLVLEDLPRPEGEATLAAMERSLRARGFDVLGLPRRGEGADAERDEAEIQLVAEARNAVGLGAPDEEDAVLRLQVFLDGTADLDAVVWLDRARGEGDPLCQLLFRGRIPADPARRFPLTSRLEGDPGR
ncbi:MAG: hypothetical protein AB1726_01135 [Planctomycetota bacterium]